MSPTSFNVRIQSLTLYTRCPNNGLQGRAKPAVKPWYDAVLVNNEAGDQYAPEKTTTLKFLGRIEPSRATPLEKGSIIDLYA